MPYNVPDAKLRGQHRAEKKKGHAKGGAHHWRSWQDKPTRAEKTAQARDESWWIGLSREAFTAALKLQKPSNLPMTTPHWVGPIE